MTSPRLHSRKLIALLLVLATATTAAASSAGFVLRGHDLNLGQPEELSDKGQPLPPRYHVKVARGQEFTLIAQGMVYPRGAAESPGEPDCAAWLFDDAAFKLLPHDKKLADKTRVVIKLQAQTEGKSRIRFVGNILGYDKTYDIMVEVVAPKK